MKEESELHVLEVQLIVKMIAPIEKWLKSPPFLEEFELSLFFTPK